MEKIDKKITKLLKSYRMLSTVVGIEAGEEMILEVIATHTKQLCVGFAEWINTWCTIDIDIDNSNNPKTYIYRGELYDLSDLYEQYLKYLKEVENGK